MKKIRKFLDDKIWWLGAGLNAIAGILWWCDGDAKSGIYLLHVAMLLSIIAKKESIIKKLNK